MLTEGAARVGEDDDAEVDTHSPQESDDEDGGHGALLEEHAAEGGGVACAVGDGVLAGHGAWGGGGDDFDFADAVFGVGEAGGFVHGGATGEVVVGERGAFVQVLGEQDEPAQAEHGGVEAIEDGVEDVEPGEGEDLKGAIGIALADGGAEVADQTEDEDAVDVVGELERVEMVAGE